MYWFYAVNMQMKNSRSAKINVIILLFFTLGVTLAGCAPSKVDEKPSETSSMSSISGSKSEDNSHVSTTPLPTPTGLQIATVDFTCANLKNRLHLESFLEDPEFIPENSSFEARANASGGTVCRWHNQSGNEWITAAVEKISPEDYRDFAESLRGFNIPVDFASSNDSLGFYFSDGVIESAKLLNSTYLINVSSNKINGQVAIGSKAVEIENLLTAR